MSTILNTEGTTLEIPKPARGGDFRAVIITARWNAAITGALTDGAIGTLHAAGVADDRITRLQVPGTVELVNAAAAAIDALRPDAVIVIGCVSPIDIVWNIADTFNGLMAIPNFVGLFALSGVVAKLTKEHFSDPAAMLEDEIYT